ncbi:hypothetical protein DYB37_000725 [Aphanomyces astaci]|uniref:WRKY19-like zinc finger domain-containing protein n=1 Tax=Aphanomyces astaci TaxID=112090 RepID=A0A3R7F2L8_APHAT|nr:hypothetical protein DYB35_007432 [Aphanomyces astaci]RHZ22360.1 hypothetical protein DYB37_000725 [Aphanomyces astaci]
MCRFVPMETVLDDTSRKMYSIVSSHLAHCKSSLESDPHTTTLQRRLDRANQRIHELEVDNGRLVDALATADILSKSIAEENATLRQTLDTSRLDELLHQANVQHVESLRHELTALQEQQNLPIHPSQPPSQEHQNQNPGSMWPPVIHNKLAHVDRLLYLLQSATSSSRIRTSPCESSSLPQSENTLAHGHHSWQQHFPPQYDVGHAMEARIHQLFQDMHMASQQVIEFQTTMSDQALNQLLDVETVLRRELDTLTAGKPTQIPCKTTATSLPIERFRKCTVPDCPKGVRSRGLCKGHGGGKQCEVRGCVKSNQGGGFCIAHGGGRRCAVDGCKSAAQIQGTCKAHRQTSANTRQSKSRSTSPCQQQARDGRAGHEVQAGEDRRRVMHHNDDGHATST